MANLSSLVHELRERIAASSSATSTTQNDEVLESRFRAVLPNLLHAYVVPSASAKEREVIAVLKLLAHTAKNFPGVFYHGKASAVVPVLCRIIPFFAEPAFRSRHGTIFETVGSLLSLLRTCDRDAFRQFFMDTMLLAEDLACAASICDKTNSSETKKVAVTSFCESVAALSNETALLSDIPIHNRPVNGYGILIDLTGKEKFLPFATSVIKLLYKSLTEGTLNVEGLVDVPCVLAICKLLCYGDDDLHMACFDFARLVGAGRNSEIIPTDIIIQSMTIILNEDVEGVSVFRSAVYDSSLAGCLHALHSGSPDEIVMSTAADLVRIFPESLLKTRSLELKAALSSAYMRIAKICPPQFWKPECLIYVLCSSGHVFQLIDCFKVAVSRLCPYLVGRIATDDKHVSMLTVRDAANEISTVGGKRHAQGTDTSESKRQKREDKCNDSGKISQDTHSLRGFSGIRAKEYADSWFSSLNLLVEFLKPPEENSNTLRTKTTLTAISILCVVFSEHPHTDLSIDIFRQMCKWIFWMSEQQAKPGNPFTIDDISIFLEAVDSLLLVQGSLSDVDKNEFFFESMGDIGTLLLPVLKLSWNYCPSTIDYCSPWKAKCLSIRILSKIGFIAQNGVDLDVLDLGLRDEAEEVRIKAIIYMPLIIRCSDVSFLRHMFNKLEILEKEKNEQVKKIIPLFLGHLACLIGYCYEETSLGDSRYKFYLMNDQEIRVSKFDNLFQGFWCSKCDGTIAVNHSSYSTFLWPNVQKSELLLNCDYTHLQSLFFDLLYDEASSEEVQVACVRMIQRILLHGPVDILLKTKTKWLQCLDFLLLHRNKTVRQAFCSRIGFFLEDSVLNSLFSSGNSADISREQVFMDKIKHAFTVAEDPLILETLIETGATIMQTVDIHSPLFLFSLILLIDQLGNPYVTVKLTASKLINRSCYFHNSGGLEQLVSKVVQVRNELYYFLSMKLANQSKLVEEFSAAVLGVETEELVKRMIPVVLPRFVVRQHHNDDQAVSSLCELAKYSNTDMVQLIVNWLPKVLAFALHQADGKELNSALQFYHEYTGSDNKEIFAAALPALLDELICFTDVDDVEEISKRLARVPRMMKDVAKILTGSEDLSGFLRNHYVGLLNSIDRKMLHTEDISLQKQAIRRIEMLIKLMGSHLSTYVPKIMVLLMHAISKDWLQGEGLSVLHFFIKELALLSSSSIKHVISQVFAALVPILERETENSSHLHKIVEILEELVLQNKIIKQNIHELPPVPNIPVLIKVNKMIQEACGLKSLKDQLRDVVVGLNHDNLNVRYMVASELRKLLDLNREEFMTLLTKEGDIMMDLVSSLITSLLKGCAEESRTSVGQRLKLICADCLGALGAVDPAKIKGFAITRFKIACADDDLIFELIHKHLARAFRAAPDTIVQDSAALAIQELLKIAGCQASLDDNISEQRKDNQLRKVGKSSPKDVNDCIEMVGRGQRLWDRFSDYVKEIIAPCLTSRFQLPNVSDSTASGIVRHDMQIAMYLLPYLVLNAVCDGTKEARRGVTEEILSVLDAAASDNGTISVHGINSGQSEVCIQAVFTLLDNLGQWVDDVEQELALSQPIQFSITKELAGKSKDMKASLPRESNQIFVQCKHVSELLDAIPKVYLAKASFRCQAYARSLLYFESYVRDKSGAFNPASERNGVFDDEDISYLMEIYSGLDEPDGLSGLASLRKSKNLQDHLLINKKAGNWAEALTSCEQALQMEPTSVQRHSDVLDCLLNMCHLQAMVTHVDGLLSRVPLYKKTWCTQGVQAAWRLGRWDLMDEYLRGAEEEGLFCSSSESNALFDLDVAKILHAMMKKDQFSVAEKIALSKQALIAPLAAAGMDSYARAYPFVVKLHLLRELEDFNSLLNGQSFLCRSFHLGEPEFSRVLEHWESRLKLTQPSLWTREPLLAFRRLVFCASGLDSQVGNCWIQYAKLCRSAGHYEVANRAILEAKAAGASNFHIEKAKLLWSNKRADGAIAELQQSLLNMPVEVIGSAAMSSITSLSVVPLTPPPLLVDTQSMNKNEDVAKTLLLYSRWIHYTGQKQKEDVISLYSRVKELQPKWEKGYFYMAIYCDEVLVDARKRQEDHAEQSPRVRPSNSAIVSSTNVNTERRWWTYLPDVLLFYAKGLHRGHKNLFQALPRLLTLWFDFGSVYHRNNLSSNKDLANVHGKVMSIMRGCLKDLPTYQWLTALPQLVSRICHQNEETVRLVKHIITSVLRRYPQQALWTIAAVTKSTVSSRREAAAEIIQAARKGSSEGGPNSMFVQFATLVDYLIKLCFHPGQAKARTINILTEFSALKRLMPVDIIMPTQESLTVNLPPCDINLTDSGTSDIFSHSDLPTISGIADDAEILSSLQRPKKIILMGSDGIERPFLCKPKDDLRKDARMMEFNTMINRLLRKCPESRRRKLYVRTFAVIPLTEDCGMVEWVPFTRGLRHILQDIYVSCGKFDRQKTNPQIKRVYDQFQGKMPEDEMLKTKVLPMFPPVFHKWFRNTFSEPAAWFRARIAYAHTAAVWSMVGHIVGLGDRHGENILFDSTTGDCVHVDFSCLFDKGLQLEKPELVPFRLTQNMIDGLGITGYEGIYLRVCEITLSTLRGHKETLMSVLETFIHDPLVEWTKSHKSSGIEVQNPHAQRAINNIEARLQGVVVGVGASPSLPLAVEGQARRLIVEAVSLKNLGKMYIWWMPWF
ncbi:serine/threonine-protein kinase ATR [Dorcoceras hygrometricum]|uniref:Serine/threonine-protein kinase ATR n=1 Tax=Dorcoceras hygrometricum TaxID=472368 RepID=A0A2Z7BYG9_9LAMI|nr:serine/threonine-protein kinase ATR [Dorcoceras hygrometricum]